VQVQVDYIIDASSLSTFRKELKNNAIPQTQSNPTIVNTIRSCVSIHIRTPQYRRVPSYDDQKSITKSNSSITKYLNYAVTLLYSLINR